MLTVRHLLEKKPRALRSIAPEAPVGLFEYVGITQYLADLFPVKVDVTNRSHLKAHVRLSAERDAIYAF